MLRRRVIPCLDVADGRVVKGTRFVDLVDEGDPPELAERYAREGADELVFLDITAAPERRGTLLDIVERTARRAFIPLTVGGGVRTVEEMRDVLRAGADKVSLNTAAVADPALIERCAAQFGSQAVVVAIDARRRGVEAGSPGGPGETGARQAGAGPWFWDRSARLGGRRTGRSRDDGPRRGRLGRTGRRPGSRRAARHLDRPRRNGVGLRYGPAACHHVASDGAGHRLGRSRGTGRFRGRRARRWRRRRVGGLDLPPADPFDRVREGGDGCGRPARSIRAGVRGVSEVAAAAAAMDPTPAAPPVPRVRFGPDGLVPAVVQDAADGGVLMLAWMDAEALSATLDTGEVHFHSRSRDRLWRKGETSGNVLRLVGLAVDCDGDALLVTAAPVGPTCHRGTRSCFDPEDDSADAATSPRKEGFVWLETLWATIVSRAASRPAGSYTTSLLDGGVDAVGRKVTEEATELLLAAKDDAMASTETTRAAIAEEAADLLYHALVLLAERGVPPSAVVTALRSRHPG